MISKLPRWVEVGAFVLALVAGLVNAIGLLSFEHQAVSHVSGTVTRFGTSLANDSYQTTFYLLGVLASFLLGSAISGFLLHGPTLKLGRHYDTVLFIESLSLAISIWFLSIDSYYGIIFASASCGIQNALATTYSGAIIRTTHMTGIFTDLGIALGALVRGEPLDKRKVNLFLLIILGFTIGGTVGALLHSLIEFYALVFPAAMCVSLSIAYRIFTRHNQ